MGYTEKPRRSFVPFKGRKPNNNNKTPNDFNQRNPRLAQSPFQADSEQNREADLTREAPTTQYPEIWLRSPATNDIPGADIKLSTAPQDQQRQIFQLAQLSQLARRKKIELEFRVPNSPTALKRFRIVKIKDVEKVTKEITELNKANRELDQVEPTDSIAERQVFDFVCGLKTGLQLFGCTVIDVSSLEI